jgi:phosphate:Na+ symporter
MLSLVEENMGLAFRAMEEGDLSSGERVRANEAIVDFENGALTKFLIKLSADASQSDERTIGSYFHVLNDLERIGDHAENFYEIAEEMADKKLSFSERGRADIGKMREKIIDMLKIAKDAFENLNKDKLADLLSLEESVDGMKKELVADHFSRLAEGHCTLEVSPYYSSAVSGLERVADHLVNVGYSIISPIGSEKETV